MRGIVLIAHVDGHLERVEQEFPLKLEWIQSVVGGYIEGVRLSEDIFGIVNEVGRLIGLPDNARYPNLAGPVILCSDYLYPGEDGDPPEPDFGPLTVAQLRLLEGGGTAPVSTVYMSRSRTLTDRELTEVRIVDPNEDRPKGSG